VRAVKNDHVHQQHEETQARGVKVGVGHGDRIRCMAAATPVGPRWGSVLRPGTRRGPGGRRDGGVSRRRWRQRRCRRFRRRRTLLVPPTGRPLSFFLRLQTDARVR